MIMSKKLEKERTAVAIGRPVSASSLTFFTASAMKN